ncbi:CAP domain-containing protein [Candidatus Parcubacteria bacterium]|nr:CAP domain-containing protein [Candidatus Parcubacteria bacterium]
MLSGFLLFVSSLQGSQVLNYSTGINDISLLETTNQARQNSGSAELKLSEMLDKAAQAKAEDMASKNYWSHITPEGEQPWNFIERSGYSYSFASENLAYGFASSNDTVKGWLNSPNHAQAMLDSKVSEVGFGIARSPDFQGKGPETIVVAMYASPSSASPASLSSQTKYLPPSNGKISFAQTITPWSIPWINFAAGLIIGLSLMYLATHHGFRLIKRKIMQGEKFIIKHPALDLALVSIVVLGIVVSRTSGFIQ